MKMTGSPGRPCLPVTAKQCPTATPPIAPPSRSAQQPQPPPVPHRQPLPTRHPCVSPVRVSPVRTQPLHLHPNQPAQCLQPHQRGAPRTPLSKHQRLSRHQRRLPTPEKPQRATAREHPPPPRPVTLPAVVQRLEAQRSTRLGVNWRRSWRPGQPP